jgi:hypothetical protein
LSRDFLERSEKSLFADEYRFLISSYGMFFQQESVRLYSKYAYHINIKYVMGQFLAENSNFETMFKSSQFGYPKRIFNVLVI